MLKSDCIVITPLRSKVILIIPNYFRLKLLYSLFFNLYLILWGNKLRFVLTFYNTRIALKTL